MDIESTPSEFLTHDPGLAAYIELVDPTQKFLLTRHADRMIFVFSPETDELKKIIHRYYNGEAVPAVTFATAISRMRSRIMAAKRK